MRTQIKNNLRRIARFATRTPDKLWQHYLLALSLLLSLIFAMYGLNTSIITRGALASDRIMASNEQVLRMQGILGNADNLNVRNSEAVTAFDDSISQFEAAHVALSAPLPAQIGAQTQAIDGDVPLDRLTSTFIALARNVVPATAIMRDETVQQMHDLHNTGGLLNDLLMAPTLIANELEMETAFFTRLQRLLVGATALVVLAEVVFVFWPAQYAIQSAQAKMKRLTNILRRSQTRLMQVDSKLKHLVNHHALTELPNRTSLEAFLGNAISNQQASEWQLYLVGIDDFKSINDMLGHAYGDGLLIAVSRALKGCVDYDDIVAHVGSDEFVLTSAESAPAVLRRIQDALASTFDVKGRRISIHASIGHVFIGTQVREPMDIVADAATALQFAKNEGGDRTQEFTEDLRHNTHLMQKMQFDLREAIEKGEIEPWFQPQVRLSDGKLHGAEVLARWRHPTRGLLMPDLFLPAAERAGLMIELDHAVWKSAMALAREWQLSKVWHPVISLNAAPDTISDPQLIERFLLALQLSGLDANQVVIEVLETTLINGNDDMAAINIDSLAECGIALELDDFGTGYASLAKLIQLPLAGLKLDRSLIAPLPDRAADSVVRAILALAGELGLTVIAEGVEEAAQATHLSDRGCGIGQGYGFGRPMPAKEFTVWLALNAAKTLHAGPETPTIAYRA